MTGHLRVAGFLSEKEDCVLLSLISNGSRYIMQLHKKRGKTTVIYTLTCNPSLDYIVSVKDFSLGKTNRTREEQMLAGGKGINVATVLKNIGIDNIALAFVAGFTGKEILRKAQECGLKCEFFTLEKGCSRINVKLNDFEGTEINGMGPVIEKEAWDRMMERLRKMECGDVLVLAGSIPGGMTSSFYRDIVKELSGKGIEVVVDATGGLLLNVLEFHPFLIKPNLHELGEIFGEEVTTWEQVIPYAKKMQELGARNVLVSMGAGGAVLATENGEIYGMEVPKGEAVNAVGAGDSMVAGFMAGYMETKDYKHALKMGISAGSASAYSKFLATGDEIKKIYDAITEPKKLQ